MTVSFSTLSPEIICDAAEVFGGRATGRIIPLNAMENRVFEVEIEDETPRIIKFYRPQRWTRSQILTEHQILIDAKNEELAVVAPLATEGGETLSTTHELLFSVFPKVRGRLEAELSKERLKSLGILLGRIHRLSSKRSGKYDRPLIDIETFARQPILNMKEKGLFANEAGKRYFTLASEILETITPMIPPQFDYLIHGDCHVGNVLWIQDTPHVIDFDDCRFGPPVQDFWMLIGGSDEHAKKSLETLLQSYETVHEFDWSTIFLIEPLRSLRMIHYVGWVGKRHEEDAFKRAFPGFGTDMYWAKQVEDLMGQKEQLHSGGSPFDSPRSQQY